MRVLILLFLLFPNLLLAEPGELYVIFLSNIESVSFIEKIQKEPRYFSPTAQKGLRSNCISFGDKCFHPQKGLIDPKVTDHTFEIYEPKQVEQKYDFSDIESTSNTSGVDGLNSEFSTQLDCKEEQFFDIYCGKAEKIKRPAKSNFEVWVDTSTSMRNSDYNFAKSTCYRKDFVDRLRSSCGAVNVYQYASSRKQISSTQTLCENHNQNSQSGLYKWIKQSNAKVLLIVTDADSMEMEFQTLIDSIGGKVYGIEDRMYGGKHLKDFVPQFEKFCKK